MINKKANSTTAESRYFTVHGPLYILNYIKLPGYSFFSSHRDKEAVLIRYPEM